jgi:hypothetical protein
MATAITTAATIALLILLAPAATALEYVESSSGLGVPELEGGHTELEFADIDADGNVDLLSIGDHGSPYINTDEHGVMVWFGDGAGNWSVYQNGNFGYGGIAVGDVNGDGLWDVGYGMHHDYSGNDFGDQLIEVALGDGTGMNWTPWDDGLATSGETWGMFGTDFADVDNDGDLDLGSNSFGCCAGVHVYLNAGDGTWSQSFGFVGGNSDMWFVFGDINRDGNADIAASNANGTVYFGDGAGAFTPAGDGLPTSSWHGTALGDVDNDGGEDISFVTGGVEVWIWDEDFEQWIDFSGSLPATGDYQETQLCDMDADGFVDLIAFGEGTCTLWLGDGTGNWTQDAQFTTPPYGHCQAFRVGGDVDHNGLPDIALVAEEGSWPSYQNHLYCFRETTAPESLTIVPVFPRGHETFMQGSAQFIDWLSAVPSGETSSVALEYSTTGSSGRWYPIVDGAPNSGRCQWTVPLVASSDCYIRYTVTSSRGVRMAITPAAFTILSDATGVYDEPPPGAGVTLRCLPNPVSSSAIVEYTVAREGRVRLGVYDVSGRLVAHLVDSRLAGGDARAVAWDGRDGGGRDLPSGVYFVRLEAGEEAALQKIVLVR